VSEIKRIYWDSCLFISYLQGKPEEKALTDMLHQLLKYSEGGALKILLSTAVIAEVRPNAAEYPPDRLALVDEIFFKDHTFVQVSAVTRNIASHARQLAATFPELKVLDTIHVSAALQMQADALFTLDGVRKAGGRRRLRDLTAYDGKIGSPALAIKEPFVPIGPLFTQSGS
jgi:predicted nucleic acid-binding protein